MSERSVRTWMLGLTFAMAVAWTSALVVMRGCDVAGTEREAARGAKARTGTRAAQPHEPRARRPEAREGAATADEDGAAGGEGAEDDALVTDAEFVREVALPGGPTGWADLDVDVLDAAGAPSLLENVHVLPPGDPMELKWWKGLNDEPRGVTGRDGRARIRVPVPARYEIRTSGMPWSLRSPPIDVAGPMQATLRGAATGDVTVVLDDLSVPDAALHVSFRADRTAVPHEGGTLAGTGVSTGELALSAAQPRAESALPSALEWDVSVSDGWVAVPRRFRPPATVHVRRETRPVVWVRCTYVPDETRVRSDATGATEVRFVAEGADEIVIPLPESARRPRGAEDEADDDEPDAAKVFDEARRKGELGLHVAARQGKVRWSGAGVVEGGADYDLDREQTIDVTVRCAAGEPDLAQAGRVTVEPWTDPPAAEATGTWVTFGADGGEMWLERVALHSGVVAHAPRPGAWLTVHTGSDGDSVAGPVRCQPGTDLRLRVQRGGWVELGSVDDPAELGVGITLVRADGAPFVDAPGGQRRPVMSIALLRSSESSTRIGPFEPGVVALDVLVGRVRWRRYEVTIRAGETTRLAVGPLGK